MGCSGRQAVNLVAMGAIEGFRAGERGGLNDEEGREGAIVFMWARGKEAMGKVPRGRRAARLAFPRTAVARNDRGQRWRRALGCQSWACPPGRIMSRG